MKPTTRTRIPTACLLALAHVSVAAADWPQFRGPQGRAVAEGPPPPIHFGADTNCLWNQPCPAGLSSPILRGDRLFLTAVEDGRLATLAWDRATGRRLWTQTITAPQLEPTHRLGSPAAPTPCADATSVYAYFGSFGVVAYDHAGKERWRHPLPPPVVEFGTSASPMLAGGSLIVVVDQDQDSFLLALNPRDGSVVWRTPRPEFRRSFATPFLWEHPAGPDLVVPGSVALTS
jgi:outer membrane protein assembly factor BamB